MWFPDKGNQNTLEAQRLVCVSIKLQVRAGKVRSPCQTGCCFNAGQAKQCSRSGATSNQAFWRQDPPIGLQNSRERCSLECAEVQSADVLMGNNQSPFEVAGLRVPM